MIAAVSFGDVAASRDRNWDSVRIRCTCGFRMSRFNMPRMHQERLQTACPRCNEKLTPPIYAASIDVFIAGGQEDMANSELRKVGSRLDAIRQVVPATCSHCNHPLLDAEIADAVRALIQLVETETK